MVRFGCSGNENAGIKPKPIKFSVANYIFTSVKLNIIKKGVLVCLELQ